MRTHPEIRQEFEYSRKLHQEFLEPAEGATHFRLIRMTFNDYKQNKQALKDLAEEEDRRGKGVSETL